MTAPRLPDETIEFPRVSAPPPPVSPGPGLFVAPEPPPPAPAPPPPVPLVTLAARHGLAPTGVRPTLIGYTRELWRYRQFIASYANGRAIASFGTARLGRLWQVLAPLINAGVYFLIFGLILGTRAGVPNFVAYLCTGVFVFTYTQTVGLGGVSSVSGQLGLVRSLAFPRASLPLAVTLTHFQSLVASMAVLIGIVVATGEPATPRWAWLVPALALQSVFNVGLALGLARLGARITDLRQLMPYVMRTWMYASGVFYSVAVFAEHLPAWAVGLVHANPLLVYIELARYALLSDPPLAWTPQDLWILGGAWALIAFVAGYVYFWRGEPRYGRG
jgi:teichoic acid transport system permease protein